MGARCGDLIREPARFCACDLPPVRRDAVITASRIVSGSVSGDAVDEFFFEKSCKRAVNRPCAQRQSRRQPCFDGLQNGVTVTLTFEQCQQNLE